MKRYIYLLVILAAILFSCKQNDVDPTSVNKVTITNEKMTYIDPTSVVVSGTYSFAGKLDGIYVLVSTSSDMANAKAYESVLNGKDFAATVTELKENTKYYYKYRYVNMGAELESEEVKDFTTIDYQVPTVITADVSEITGLSAKCGGEVTHNGYLEVTARGVCWSKTSNPTTECEHTTDGSGVGAFTSEITNLEPDTRYYVCAYATNSKDTGYGEVKQFTTMDGDSDIYTGAISDITVNSAVCKSSKVNDGGGLDITDKGLCWATHSDPTTGDIKVSKGSGLGEFTVDITGLEYGVKYYVRAYSVNIKETKYGNEREFTTMDGIPVVTTSAVTNIMATTATCGGNVTDDGGLAVTERGICWSKSANPTIEDSHKQSGSGTGSFTVNLDNLEMDETYHVRAYAKNSYTVSYGDDVTFTTKDGKPVVTTSAVTNIMATTVTCSGNVTDDGGLAVTERGICWSKSANPTIEDSHKQSGTGTGSFTVNLDNLEMDETYHVRAYAKNSYTVSYGDDVTFTTKDGKPVVTTSAVTNIMATTVTCGGNVTEDYGFAVTERGVCWSTSQNPTTSNNHTTDGSGTGLFTSSITGLTQNTTYYVRAYATNSAGTGYGEQIQFSINYMGGHEYVDLGLPSGLLWATCNVGAENPEDYGSYFAWGETSPKSDYDWDTYQWCNGSSSTLTKYCTQSSYGYNGFVDNKTVLEPADDAAHVNWGGDWRMPTRTEMEELKNNCTWTWTTQGGKNGYRVTGSNNNSIFLPAAGYYDGSSLYGAGYYWSSSLYTSSPHYAYNLYFYSGSVNVGYYYRRYGGQSVRPVCQSQN